MTDRSDSALRRYAPAACLALLIWTTAPFLGLLRDALFERYSDSAVRTVAVTLAVGLGTVMLWAGWRVVRLVGFRPWRWAGMAGIVALLWFQAHGFRLGVPSSDVVEKIHIVEYGLLAILLYRGARRVPRLWTKQAGDAEVVLVPLFGAALAGIVDESVQGFFQLRTGDVRDVALNALAGATGLLLALVVAPPDRWQALPGRKRRGLALLPAATVLAAGLFFQQFHLGHEIVDPEIGRFVSWHNRDELLRLQREKARLWAESPPTLKAWHAEDYYLTEAAWHANHRNASLQDGDRAHAAHANRILETYYAPFLDLESFRDAGRHRWPENLRDEIYRAEPAAPDVYVSPVLASRIETRVSSVVWLLASALAALVVFLVASVLPASGLPKPQQHRERHHRHADDDA